MKNLLAILLLITTALSTAQPFKKDSNFGKITADEFALANYEKDTAANALVLYESGKTYFDIENNLIVIKTLYHYKIKIFNADGYSHATFKIPIYNKSTRIEKVEDVEAITHNGLNKTFLSKNQIFTDKMSDHWKEVRFTMPNLKPGCIVELSYVLVSPFKFNLTGWTFQSDIPKLVSEYKAHIPGNYMYNRKLKGFLKLTTNTSTVNKNCFSVPRYKGQAHCENIHYRMENIPAFIVEEYMTSKDDYLAQIKFELKETLWFDGTRDKYTTTWEVTDKEFKRDKNIGIQLKKTKYFDDLIPEEIRNIPSELEKAKAVHNFIKDYFSWNEKYGIFGKSKLKTAIENKTGNATEINISLINALKSVGLDTELMLLSTRNNGFPTKLYPVISDFNYVIAKVNINNKVYLLDATDKWKPFGQLPFKCLNEYGRVMDFENASYWYDIKSESVSKSAIYANLELTSDGKIIGKMRRVRTNYTAYNRRKEYLGKSEDDIVSEFENEFLNLTVESYELQNRNDIDKPLVEIFEIEIDFDNKNKIYFNPFFGGSFDENPFKQENRLYPVDFGYKRNYNLNLSLELPDNYGIESMPKSSVIKFSDESTSFSLLVRNNQGYKITINGKVNIGKTTYYNTEYKPLKDLFKQVIELQKTPIVFVKKEE